jgi:alkylated DNA repair dioxygenase AlkB
MYDIPITILLNTNQEMKITDNENRHYVEVNGTYLVVPRSLMWYRHNTKTNMWSGEIIPRDKQVTWVQQDNGYFVEKLHRLKRKMRQIS